MATQTRVISGTTVTYTITDYKSNVVTVAATIGGSGVIPADGVTMTGTAIQPDGMLLLWNLLLLLSNGLMP